MVQTRYRRIGLAAVAIFFGVVTSVGTAFAATPPDDPGRSASAPASGLEKKAVDDAGSSDVGTTTATDTVSAAASTATPSDATVSASASASAAPAAAAAPAAPAAASNGNGNGFGANQAANAGSNGNGGKPCAGCVGNADGKTPKGQSSNDKNRGHECDDNKGIGKGNPAHSPCPTTPPPATNTDTSTSTSNAAVAATTATPSAQVLGVSFERPAEVLGVQLTRGAGLAFTGAATTPLMATAIALVCIGAAFIAISRRNKDELVRCAARLSGHTWISAI